MILPDRSRSLSPTTQMLEFLAVTGLPASPESRRIVRSHAIRDANRRKKETKKECSPERKPTNAPSQQSFTSRFRIRGTEKANPTNRKSVAPKAKVPEVRVRLKQRKGRLETMPDVERKLQSVVQVLVGDIRDINKSHERMPLTVGSTNFDPFDMLPVKMGEKQHALLHYRAYNCPSIRIPAYFEDVLH